jgi:hypothetical protein
MRVRVVCLALIVPMVAAAAHADPDDDSAAVHLERGLAAYRAREFRRALDELLQANRRAPDLADPFRWIALTEAEIDDCRSALINIDTFVSLVPAGDPRVPELVALRDRCQHTGNLTVESTPSGAALRVDNGSVVGTTPVSRLAMRTGRHTITVEKPGWESQSRDVDVYAFATDHASFALTAVHETQLAHRWWFWAGLGVATAVLAVVAYDARRPDTGRPDTGLPPVTCTASGCQP